MTGPHPGRAATMVERLGFLPTAEQELLLKAIVCDGSEALDGWNSWRRLVDIQHIDGGSFRLLPQLYRKLVALDVHDPDLMPVLKGTYRQALYRNHLLTHRAKRLFAQLEERDIPFLVLKGVALTHLYLGHDMGIRPMNDFDFLVPHRCARLAADVLEEDEQWSSVLDDSWEHVVATCHGRNYKTEKNLELDLHWNLFFEARFPGADDPFFRQAVPFSLDELELRTLCPAHFLLHVCAHGARLNDTPPIRWVTDATAILATAGDRLDWDELVRQTRRLHLVLVVRAALDYLADNLGAPVPRDVVTALPLSSVTRPDYWYFENAFQPLDGWNVPGHLFWDYWMTTGRGQGFLRGLFGFWDHLRVILGLPSRWQVLTFVLHKTVGIVGRTVTGRARTSPPAPRPS